MAVEIIQGDAYTELKKLPEKHFHCCVTSPPFWGLRDYGVDGQLGLEKTPEEYVAKMVEIFGEVRRVLRDDGTLWLNLGDSYAGGGRGSGGDGPQNPKQRTNLGAYFDGNTGFDHGLKPKDLCGIPWRVAFALQADGWYLRSDIVWAKPNPMPESVRDRPTKAHEFIFLLAKSQRYFFDAEAVKEDAVCGTDLGLLRGKSQNGPGANPAMIAWHATSISDRQRQGVDSRCGNPSGRRNIRTVWTIPTKPFTGWQQTYRLVREAPDGPCGGMMHTVSPNCAIHGGLFDLHAMLDGDGHEADSLSRILRKRDYLAQELPDGFFATVKRHAYYCGPHSWDWLLQECSRFAKFHSSGNHKKAHGLLTSPSCMPSAERTSRIVRMLMSRGLSETCRGIYESNTWPADLNAGLLAQMQFRKLDTDSSQRLLNRNDCLCEVYHIKRQESTHFATYPPELIRPCILAGCPMGGHVLDPFAGSGTTGEVAEMEGRNSTLIELNPEYIELIRNRTSQKGLFARVE